MIRNLRKISYPKVHLISTGAPKTTSIPWWLDEWGIEGRGPQVTGVMHGTKALHIRSDPHSISEEGSSWTSHSKCSIRHEGNLPTRLRRVNQLRFVFNDIGLVWAFVTLFGGAVASGITWLTLHYSYIPLLPSLQVDYTCMLPRNHYITLGRKKVLYSLVGAGAWGEIMSSKLQLEMYVLNIVHKFH